MDLDWSQQSPHIRTLYHSWQAGDGYEEAVLMASEARLGIRLPTSLRAFYQTWGRRRDLTQTYESLLEPDALVMWSDALVFCAENQGACCWAIQREDLNKSNPPIVIADAELDWEIHAPLTWRPNYPHLSDFLDDLTYKHALCGGAIHGGFTNGFRHQEYQNIWLEQHWHRITVGPLCFGLTPEAACYNLPFYVRDNQALAWFYGCSVAARSLETLDEISQALQVTWVQQW